MSRSVAVTVDGKTMLFTCYEELLVYLLKERGKGRRARVTYVDGRWRA